MGKAEIWKSESGNEDPRGGTRREELTTEARRKMEVTEFLDVAKRRDGEDAEKDGESFGIFLGERARSHAQSPRIVRARAFN